MSDEPKDKKFELKERFVWKWHPHAWLIALLVILIIFLFRNFVR